MIEGSDKYNFLDVTLIKYNKSIKFKSLTGSINLLFQANILTSRYNILFHKKSTIMGMTDRAFLLSHPKYHAENIKFIVDVHCFT